jgi:hypothetical protein
MKMGMGYWEGKTEALGGGGPVPLSLISPQILQGLARGTNRAYVVTGRRPTARAMARAKNFCFRVYLFFSTQALNSAIL